MVVDVTASDTTVVLQHVLQVGMDVVLANKRPITERRADAEALREAALASGRHLLFEATVGAGLPVIDTARKLVESGDRIRRIEGCLSGTLGFLLTEVSAGRGFADALREAMRRGYTERDPREDLSGMDVARKPGGVHHRPLPRAPAGHHRARRRARGHGGRADERRDVSGVRGGATHALTTPPPGAVASA